MKEKTRLASGLQFLMFRAKDQKPAPPRRCPQCHYVLERPHALHCARCMAEIPQATGCKGCGQCRKSRA